MNRKYIAILLSLITVLPIAAQRAKKKVVQRKKPVVEVPQEDPRIVSMHEATQQIVFVDSIVVDKNQFLSHYYLSPESGRLCTYSEFFQRDEQPYAIVYLNELGNKAFFSRSGRLYTTDLLGGKEWNEPTQLPGIDDEKFTPANYPFMMADGTTLYFASGGEESIGGLDIFVTRFDSNTSNFLLPENIGMPFNSEANDYMMAIDEMNNIGYFATDRRQPEGKVCIYSFIPNQLRRTYDTNEIDEQTLRNYAEIHCIAETWGKGDARQQALSRLKMLRGQASVQTPSKDKGQQAFVFYIDDQTTYHSLKDFLLSDNRTRYQELEQSKERLVQLGQVLDKLRTQYAANKDQDRFSLSDEILKTEQQYYKLQSSLRQLEKDIRNTEIQQRQQ